MHTPTTISITPSTDAAALVGRTFTVRWSVKGVWYSGRLTIDQAFHSTSGLWLGILGLLDQDGHWGTQNTSMALEYGLAELLPL